MYIITMLSLVYMHLRQLVTYLWYKWLKRLPRQKVPQVSSQGGALQCEWEHSQLHAMD